MWQYMRRAVVPVLLATLLAGVVVGALLSTAGRAKPTPLGPAISVELDDPESTASPVPRGRRGDDSRRRSRQGRESDDDGAPRGTGGERRDDDDGAEADPAPAPAPAPAPVPEPAPD
ncbi:MAG: hypothetical protein M3493_12780, partial [Actinomycetota bacterium]|nr:hypothetical protein [Actinomycetota bacterium]